MYSSRDGLPRNGRHGSRGHGASRPRAAAPSLQAGRARDGSPLALSAGGVELRPGRPVARSSGGRRRLRPRGAALGGDRGLVLRGSRGCRSGRGLPRPWRGRFGRGGRGMRRHEFPHETPDFAGRARVLRLAKRHEGVSLGFLDPDGQLRGLLARLSFPAALLLLVLRHWKSLPRS